MLFSSSSVWLQRKESQLIFASSPQKWDSGDDVTQPSENKIQKFHFCEITKTLCWLILIWFSEITNPRDKFWKPRGKMDIESRRWLKQELSFNLILRWFPRLFVCFCPCPCEYLHTNWDLLLPITFVQSKGWINRWKGCGQHWADMPRKGWRTVRR